MKRLLLLPLILLACVLPLRADSIDQAEAAKRGVAVEVIQLEHANARIAELEKQVASLQRQLARAAPATSPASQPSTQAADGPASDGLVHVRGYTKKDGTYVAPYTRSAPGSGRSK